MREKTPVHRDLPDDRFVVVCRDDMIGRRKGPYVLATRRVFESRAEAEHYALTVAEGRAAIVVAGRFHQLRIGNTPVALREHLDNTARALEVD